MIDPLAHFNFILVAWLVALLWRFRGAEMVLMLGGIAYLLIYAPVAAAWIAFTCLEACALFLAFKDRPREDGWRKYGAYLLLPNFLFVDVHPLAFGFNVETLAISFSTIRIFMTAKQLLSARTPPPLGSTKWIFVSAFYLPALLIGPVFSGLDLEKQAKSETKYQPQLSDFRLLLQGLVLVFLANPAMGMVVASVVSHEAWNQPHFVAAPFLFLQLFTAFWGQSLIAEHTSRYFGFVLPVNFDMPWRANNIRDFWQRWHRSMAQFVMQYIFLPLNLKGVSPRLATISAFVFMGAWHNLEPGYLFWGFGHGFLLAFWPKEELAGFRLYAGAVITWVAVIMLSYIANFGVPSL